ncbi:hypothetical protein ACE6H2_010868 [Prunus campanulata]
MERFFKRKSSSGSGSSANVDSSNNVGSSRTPSSRESQLDGVLGSSSRQSQLDGALGNLQADPGLRTRMIDYDANMRDEVRRSYLQKGPCVFAHYIVFSFTGCNCFSGEGIFCHEYC